MMKLNKNFLQGAEEESKQPENGEESRYGKFRNLREKRSGRRLKHSKEKSGDNPLLKAMFESKQEA